MVGRPNLPAASPFEWPSATDTERLEGKADTLEEVKKTRRIDYHKLFTSAGKLDLDPLKDGAARPLPEVRDLLDPRYHGTYVKLLHFAAVFLRHIITVTPQRPVLPVSGPRTRSKANRREHLSADAKGCVKDYEAFTAAELNAA